MWTRLQPRKFSALDGKAIILMCEFYALNCVHACQDSGGTVCRNFNFLFCFGLRHHQRQIETANEARHIHRGLLKDYQVVEVINKSCLFQNYLCLLAPPLLAG